MTTEEIIVELIRAAKEVLLDDKFMVITAVTVISIVTVAVLKEAADVNIVYGGLFGMATGSVLTYAKMKGMNNDRETR